ncbi:type II/IV secretion system ATPase subunit [Candidatus Micrarchaeota archaeon]|nr:type II/IV secretion system ATPase subunit [Candidatus Micrarchaeota archaeon]
MKILSTYKLENEKVVADVRVVQRESEYINTYELEYLQLNEATRAVLNTLKEKIIEKVDLKISDLVTQGDDAIVRKKFTEKAKEFIKKEFPNATAEEEDFLLGKLIQEMLGLGDLELMLADAMLEEIIVNSSKEPLWVYHRKFGWLKSNVTIATESQIQNYSEIIARKIGRQITTLTPLLDANLVGGSRVNSVLFPIASKGNSIVIRKFRADPWTIINMIDPAVNTLTAEVAALLWLCVQYEMNILVGGGTGSGKTSFLNSIMLFTPTNQRIVSIEDTRELVLPIFTHWTPMITRQPNSEGKGEITMLDLMVNSLRMRPDRIIVGEVRRQREAETMFEAMHTGHAVYSTFHAEDVFQLKSRLVNPPVNIPELSLGALNLAVIQYRQRRSGIRRTFEIAEFIEEDNKTNINVIYRWNPATDQVEKVGESIRLYTTLGLYTGMKPKEITLELENRAKVLTYMVKRGINMVNDVGRIIAWYYVDKEKLLRIVNSNLPPDELLNPQTSQNEVVEKVAEKKLAKPEIKARSTTPNEAPKDGDVRKKLKAIFGKKLK